eukprot:m.69228 g.69228  ORF g.69228 m.69228 type:complete len:199 (-) comp13967_c0_seq2:45-641(-)
MGDEYDDDFEDVEEDVEYGAPEQDLTEAMALNRRLRALEASLDGDGMDSKPQQRHRVAATKQTGHHAPRKTAVTTHRPPGPRKMPREDATHTRDEMQRIQRDNLALLDRLERVQVKGGAINTRQAPAAPQHVAASAVNRKKKMQSIHQENAAFLKRLETVKSSGLSGGARRARPGPPKKKSAAAASPKRRVQRPEWVD